MQVPPALAAERLCHLPGLVAVDRHLVIVPLHQPHRFAAPQVDCRKQFHSPATSSKLAEGAQQPQPGLAALLGVELGAEHAAGSGPPR